jgi:hypothetical protein
MNWTVPCNKQLSPLQFIVGHPVLTRRPVREAHTTCMREVWITYICSTFCGLATQCHVEPRDGAVSVFLLSQQEAVEYVWCIQKGRHCYER